MKGFSRVYIAQIARPSTTNCIQS